MSTVTDFFGSKVFDDRVPKRSMKAILTKDTRSIQEE